MNIKPTADNVIIRPDKPEEVTKSGLIIAKPSGQKEAPERGIVVAMGHDADTSPHVRFKEGDYVLFGKYDFDVFKWENEELSIGKAEKVLAIIEVPA